MWHWCWRVHFGIEKSSECNPVNAIPFHARRATLDDLPALRGLWQTAMLPAEDFERHLREFRLIEGWDGRLIGAVGFQILGTEARIYGEAFTHSQTEELVKSNLLNHLKWLAQCEGVHRIWIRGKSAFGEECGFQFANVHLVKKLPADFGNIADWQVVNLMNEETERRIDQQVSDFRATMEEEQSRLFRITKRARLLTFFIFIAYCLFFFYLIFFIR